ncbi:MAG: hybrid sensor histidine kinase/response regulator [Myxococcota bacterium]|jgi:two-component system sensor histidine kinase and response regulator WspE
MTAGAKSAASGFSMDDLFKTEVETHAAVLVSGLLEMERGAATPQLLSALMRAAHSIKGAARVVNRGAVVKVAHALEDCFVAAQKGSVQIAAGNMDTLLKAVDCLKDMSGSQAPDTVRAEGIATAVRAIITDPGAAPAATPVPVSAPVPAPAPVTVPVPAAPAAPAAPERAVDEADRVVRVNSSSMDRMLGYAGDTVVQSRWQRSFVDGLLNLHTQEIRLSEAMSSFEEAMPPGGSVAGDAINDARQILGRIGRELADITQGFEASHRRMTLLCERMYREATRSRMRPFSDIAGGFPRMVRDLSRELGKSARLVVEGADTPVDRDILEKLEAPITHLLRNAVDHGVESPAVRESAGKSAGGVVKLQARHRGGSLMITVSDDGAGADIEKLRASVVSKGLAVPAMAAGMSRFELLEFLFLPGFSTRSAVTELSGRGVGLDVVRSMVKEVGGSVRVDAAPGSGMKFEMILPLTLSIMRALVVELCGDPYAMPLAKVDRCLCLGAGDLSWVEERPFITVDGEISGVVWAREMLGMEGQKPGQNVLSLVMLQDGAIRIAVVVDRFLGERDIVVRPLDQRLGKVPDVAAASIAEDGNPMLILDTDDLIRSATSMHNRTKAMTAAAPDAPGKGKPKRILVVDDSITVREVERRILEGKGYQVDVAVDGAEGWNAVRVASYDLVVSDVDMPRMNGIELVRRIKGDARLASLPVMIVSYKDSDADRMAGLEAGASYYFNKSSFDDDRLTVAVADLIGEAGD